MRRGICEHNHKRTRCKECRGGSICEHNRIRHICKECKGGGICEHNREHGKCKECKGKGICEHNRQRNDCSTCKPDGVFRKYKRCASSKRLSFTLMLDQFKDFVIQPCFYCGEDKEPRGIDRWDNSVGYSFENSLPCCRICNMFKKAMTGRAFITHCQRIGSYTSWQGL